MFRTPLSPLAVVALVAGCAPVEEPATLALFGAYREPVDPCRIAGETAYTNRFLDDSADLVACPEGDEEVLRIFVSDVNAREVDRVAGYVLYSVPRPGR